MYTSKSVHYSRGVLVSGWKQLCNVLGVSKRSFDSRKRNPGYLLFHLESTQFHRKASSQAYELGLERW